MDEKVEISLARYEKMREKEREFDNCVADAAESKRKAQEKSNETIVHLLKFTREVANKVLDRSPASTILLNDAAKIAGFTVIYEFAGTETKLGDGTGLIYHLKGNNND